MIYIQVFRIPQIGYSATTPDLSDKEQAWIAQAI